MSREALAVVKLEETKLLLAADVAASFSVPLALFEKAEKYSPVPLVGDAKGLSGRLCSKLQQDSQLVKKKNYTSRQMTKFKQGSLKKKGGGGGAGMIYYRIFLVKM